MNEEENDLMLKFKFSSYCQVDHANYIFLDCKRFVYHSKIVSTIKENMKTILYNARNFN